MPLYTCIYIHVHSFQSPTSKFIAFCKCVSCTRHCLCTQYLDGRFILPVEVVFCLQLRLFQIEVLLQQDKARDLIILPHDQSLCSSEAGV